MVDYNPERAIEIEQDLVKLADRLEPEDAQLVREGVGLIISMWCRLALVRRAVK